MSVTAVVVGPCTVRAAAVMGCRPTELAAAALAGIDDEFALIDDQPVGVAGLWREMFSMLDGYPATVLIHPSWWADRRIATVSHAARSVVPDVTLARRSEMLAVAVAHRPSIVVEIADSFVALSRPNDARPVRAVSRADAPPMVANEVVDEVAALTGARGAVVIDRADGVGGGAQLGELITDLLRAQRFTVTVIDDDRLLTEVPESVDDETTTIDDVVPTSRRRRARVWSLAGGVAAAGALAAAVMVAGDPILARSPPTLLVEGRVVLEVPATWSARRITAGPGSARVQVTSPTDPRAALHVTQSPVPPGETLARTADTLRRAMLAEQPGVFVDFTADARRAGRPAVTYREIRDGHDILWTVLLDGPVRISIGCQSAHGSEEVVRTACERAIASARNIGELAGTVAPHSQSNST